MGASRIKTIAACLLCLVTYPLKGGPQRLALRCFPRSEELKRSSSVLINCPFFLPGPTGQNIPMRPKQLSRAWKKRMLVWVSTIRNGRGPLIPQTSPKARKNDDGLEDGASGPLGDTCPQRRFRYIRVWPTPGKGGKRIHREVGARVSATMSKGHLSGNTENG